METITNSRHETKHRRVKTNGIWMHIAEKGEGPLVLLIHGFPQLWCCWTHQIDYFSERGYHVVAPDMRGYGGTDCPPDPSSYTVFHIVGDLIGLLDDLGQEQCKKSCSTKKCVNMLFETNVLEDNQKTIVLPVYHLGPSEECPSTISVCHYSAVLTALVVGHDWGAEIAWHLALFRPDRVKALVNLGVPYRPRSPELKPTQIFSMFGEGFYVSQFQEPGRAEKSFSKYDSVTVLKKFLFINAPDLLSAPSGMEIIDFLETPSSLPPWINEHELQYSAANFHKTGFTGAFNYYRAMDMNWELLGPWQGAKITVPTKLIVGDKDVGFVSFGTKDYINGDGFKNLVPNIEVVVLDGHHFIQQEKAELVSLEILSFFNKHSLL